MNKQFILFLFGFIVLILIRASSVCAIAENQVAIHYEEARKLYLQASQLPSDDLIGKELLYRKAVEFYPNDPEILNNLGDVYEALQQYDLAIFYYQKAIEVNPSFVVSIFSLGDLYYRMRDFEKAKRYYQEGLKFDPDDTLARQRINQIGSQESEGNIILAEQIIPMLKTIVLRRQVASRYTSFIFSQEDIPFETGSAVVPVSSYPQLDEIGKALSSEEIKDKTFEITGYSDDGGTEGLEQILSEQRALSIAQYLIHHFHLEPSRIKTIGYGKSRPLSRTNIKLNRRIEIRITDQDKKPMVQTRVGCYYLKDSKDTLMKEGMALSSQDNYRIYFRPEQDCYVYIFQRDSTEKVVQIFPNREFTACENPLQAQHEYWIPENGAYFYLDYTKGLEEIFLVISTKPAKDIEELSTQLSRNGGEETLRRLKMYPIKGFPEHKEIDNASEFTDRYPGRDISNPGDFCLVFSLFNQGF